MAPAPALARWLPRCAIAAALEEGLVCALAASQALLVSPEAQGEQGAGSASSGNQVGRQPQSAGCQSPGAANGFKTHLR